MGTTQTPAGCPLAAATSEGLILVTILAATLIAQFDLFAVNVAAPAIQQGLGMDAIGIQLALGGYSLTYGSLLILGGRLGDAFGAAHVLKIGMLGFGAASLACAASQSGPEIIVGRLVQGAAAGVMVPQVFAIVTHRFPSERRRAAAGWFGVTLGLGAALAQSLGGLLVQANVFGLGWRMVFLIVVPVAVVGAWRVGRVLPESPPELALAPDLLGSFGIALGMMGLFTALNAGPVLDWPPWTVVCTPTAVLVLAATVRHERRDQRRGRHPVLDVTLFSIPTFRLGLVINVVYFLAFGGFLYAMTFTLQRGLGESPVSSGLIFVPQGLGFAIAAVLGVRLGGRWGPRLVTAGAAISTTACGLLILRTELGVDELRPGGLWPFMALLGVGNGLAIPAMIAAVLIVISPSGAGAAAGMLTTAQQLALAFGVAIFGSVLTLTTDQHPQSPSSFRQRTARRPADRNRAARRRRARLAPPRTAGTSRI